MTVAKIQVEITTIPLLDKVVCTVTPQNPEYHSYGETHVVFQLACARLLTQGDIDDMEKAGSLGPQVGVSSIGWNEKHELSDDGEYRTTLRKIWRHPSRV